MFATFLGHQTIAVLTGDHTQVDRFECVEFQLAIVSRHRHDLQNAMIGYGDQAILFGFRMKLGFQFEYAPKQI